MALNYPRALGPGVREAIGDDELREVGGDDGVALLRPGAGRDVLVLHQRPPDTAAVLDEADRLGWLAGRGGAPGIVADGRADEGDEAVVIRVAADAVTAGQGHPMGPEALATDLAARLRALHELERSRCPFAADADTLAAVAAERIRLGRVTTASSGPYAGRPPRELLDLFRRSIADLPADTPAVVHAGLRADRIWFHHEHETVFTGWRHAGIGDRHLDLAAAAAVVAAVHGPALVPHLIDAYGFERVDPRRLDAYQLLAHLLT